MATEKRLIEFEKARKNVMNILAGKVTTPVAVKVAAAMEEAYIDAVEVIRCKDCKHYDNSKGLEWCNLNSGFYTCGIDWHSFPEDGYCSYGERCNNE